MRPFFSGSRYIAKELLLSSVERSDVAAVAQRRWLYEGRHGRFYAMMPLLLGFWLAGNLLLERLRGSHGWPDLTFEFLMVWCAVLVVGFAIYRARCLGPFVYAELRDRGYDICPRCGYMRAGIDEIDPCPECGTLAAANLL